MRIVCKGAEIGVLVPPIRCRERAERKTERPPLKSAKAIDVSQWEGEHIAAVRRSLPEEKRWIAIFMLNGAQVKATVRLFRAAAAMGH